MRLNLNLFEKDQCKTQIQRKKYSDFVDSGFVKTCDELVIDLKILGQLADLLSGVDEEVLPLLMKSLEPILPGSFWQDLFQWPFLHNLNSAAFSEGILDVNMKQILLIADVF